MNVPAYCYYSKRFLRRKSQNNHVSVIITTNIYIHMFVAWRMGEVLVLSVGTSDVGFPRKVYPATTLTEHRRSDVGLNSFHT